MTDRVIVTGGFGFAGAPLVAALSASADVCVLDNGANGGIANLDSSVKDKVAIAECDLTNADEVKAVLADRAPAVIYHLAAIHYIPLCERAPGMAVGVNVAGTANLLDACRALDEPPTVVLASTAAVYAPSNQPHHEGDVLGPVDIYGLTKLWAEQLIRLYATQTGARTAIARLFNLVGAGETNPHLIPTVFHALQAGREVRLGNLTSKRDYVYVGDIVEGFQRLAAAAQDGSPVVCNLGSGQAHSGKEVMTAISDVLGRKFDIIDDASRYRPSDRPLLQADTAYASELLGWQPQTPLRESLRSVSDRPFAASYVSD